MNKKGFIATSLLYSFFLLFCGLVLLFVGNIAQKSLLLNKELDKINEDLHSIKYIKDVDNGSYFRLNICIDNDKSAYFNKGDTLDYILFDNSNGLFIGKNYSFKLNSLELINNILDAIYVKNGDLNIISRSMSINDYYIINNYNSNLKNLLLLSDFSSNTRYLLANNRNNYNNSEVYIIDNKNKSSIYNSYLTDDKTFVRLVFEINKDTLIIGGDGTLSNPYILKGGASLC